MVRSFPTGRRGYLASIAGVAFVGAAGCLGDDDDGTDDWIATFTILEEESAGVPGDPIAGATVTLNGDDQETDDDGETTFEGLDEGEYTAEIDADGYGSDELEFSLDETNTRFDTTVTLASE